MELLSITQTKQDLFRVFQQLDGQSCPSFYNFHLHTLHSDGQCDPLRLYEQAIHLGLKGLAITDHHSVEAYLRVVEWQQAHRCLPSYPQIWSGVEITADLLAVDVHILGYAFDPAHGDLRPYLQGDAVQGALRSAEAVIQAIHSAGGIAVLAHPARYKKSAAVLVAAAADLRIDGVETYYCYGSDHPWEPSPKQTKAVKALGDRYSLLNTCGTDTHGLDITRRR
ncbi:PHP domain-containing protein [Lyngbya confervoides]|uniref:PHP domain-containing protein n=1 Tax=Lyngbya confervoides BDU141951 TaxID=1574623 RepID=A0ABD4T6F6_9CYAN|nr:PHP domain-containing protein [Lyngbya confervoides]MCM1984142.1 PHP domain-containing protein [Lyngbya confervoides BDU141951]